MAAATTTTALGTIFAIESVTPGTYTTLADIMSIQEPEASMGTWDDTLLSHTDGIKRRGAGLIEYGPASITISYDGESTTYTTITTQFLTRTSKNYKITLPGSSTRIFGAFITNISKETPIDDKMSCTIEFTPAGAVTEAVV